MLAWLERLLWTALGEEFLYWTPNPAQTPRDPEVDGPVAVTRAVARRPARAYPGDRVQTLWEVWGKRL